MNFGLNIEQPTEEARSVSEFESEFEIDESGRETENASESNLENGKTKGEILVEKERKGGDERILNGENIKALEEAWEKPLYFRNKDR